jgi:hypothetical protein
VKSRQGTVIVGISFSTTLDIPVSLMLRNSCAGYAGISAGYASLIATNNKTAMNTNDPMAMITNHAVIGHPPATFAPSTVRRAAG